MLAVGPHILSKNEILFSLSCNCEYKYLQISSIFENIQFVTLQNLQGLQIPLSLKSWGGYITILNAGAHGVAQDPTDWFRSLIALYLRLAAN